MADRGQQQELEVAFKSGNMHLVEQLLTRMRPVDVRVLRTRFRSLTVSSRVVAMVSLLHLAAYWGWKDIAVCLVAVHNCSPTWKDGEGHVSLHYAAYKGHLEVVKYFTAELHCDPMDRNNDNNTPLHYACRCGHLNIAQYLISELRCNPSCEGNGGWTPLHLACFNKHAHIVQYLLSTGHVNPLAGNKSGRTSLSIAIGKYDIIKLLQPFVDCIGDYPVHTFTKLILTGDSGAGKTTIAQLIITISAHRSGSGLAVDYCVADHVKHLTAGIVPHRIESNLGNFVIYDFAGQQEYYSSHAAILEQVMRNTAAIFICMVDLSKSNDSICQSLQYWLSFIDNACSTVEGRSHITIVGSHADLVRSSEEKRSLLRKIATVRVKCQEYAGCVTMDCRRADTDASHELISILANSQEAITASQPSISFYCHVLYAFLCTKLSVVGCTLQHLTSAIADENDSSLPSDPSILSEYLTTLSDKSLILFLKHSTSSWIVVKTESLLKEINATLFAPSHFSEHRNLASNTGIVPVSNLHKVFPHYNTEMLIGFLESLDFCRSVDHSVLQYTNLQTTTPSHSTADLLFFPGLVQSERPDSLIQQGTLQFGWCLGCMDDHQFLSSRFLQVLLLSVAYKFSLASQYSPSASLSGLERKCTIWRNGIYWINDDNITTVVELINNNRWVVVAMSYKYEYPVMFAKLLGSLITLVRHLQQEHCAIVKVSEFLISPDHIQQYPFDDLPCSTVFDMRQVARSILCRKPVVLSYKYGENCLETQSLYFEPYHHLNPSYVCQLFNPSLSYQPVPDSLLHEIRKFCRQSKMKPQVYKELREYLDSLSIFAGSNPLEVAELKEEDLSSDSTAAFGDPYTILSIADLSQVNQFLKSVNNWQSLGLELGLLQPTLKRIDEEQHGVIDKCRTEMLAAWLQQDDNIAKRSYPRWAVLKTALGNIGKNNLESEIDQSMKMFNSTPVNPKTVMESIKVTVTMRIIKIEAQGYPGTGKTSLLNLAMGEDPPPTRDSTDFVEPPSRYMVSETSGGKWEKLSTDKILEGISTEVEKVINSQAMEPLMDYEQSSFKDVATHPLESVSTQAQTEISQPSPQPLLSISQQLQSIESSDNELTNTTRPTLTHQRKKANPYSTAVSELLKKVGSIKNSTEIFSLKWVIVSDCGGQPPFLDAAALFLRNSSLRIIPLKLSDRLNANADISYFVGDKNCLTDSYVPLTNQQTIETFVKSVAATQPLCTPSTGGVREGRTCRCKFTIIGTFKDKEHESESVERKEEILKDVLQPYEFFQVCGDRFILPINAAIQPGPERNKAAEDLRRLIESSDVSREFKVKLRWFLFLLGMINTAEEKKKAVFSIKDDECFELGKTLGMEKGETIEAINFFHDIGLMMHFDGDLEDYVVVDDEPVLQKISQLLSVSFFNIKDFNKLYATRNGARKQSLKSFFSETPLRVSATPLSSDIQQNLQEYGRFHRRYLEFLNLTKKELDFFLKMLVHINAIAETNNEEYFMPCALPYKKKPKRSNEFPWIVRFRMKMERAGLSVDNYIPPPVGYLPVLVVFLVTKFSSEFSYPTGDECQYRNYITLAYKQWRVYIIERHLQLEFYFSGGCEFQTEFSNVYKSILDAISKTESRLQIADGVERLNRVLCTCKSGRSFFSACDCEELHVSGFYFHQEKHCYYTVCDKSYESRFDVEPKNLLWMKAAEPHKTEPAAVTCSKQTGAKKQPVINAVHGGDRTNQEEAGLKEEDISSHITGNAAVTSVNLSDIPEGTLDADTLPFLMKALASVACQWKHLGDQLRLEPWKLEAIDISEKSRPINCMREMLVAWLKGSGGACSKQALITALENIRCFQ